MNLLPYWENDLDFEVSDLFSYGLDWNPVSSNRFYGKKMEELARGAFALDSEFLYINGASVGHGGAMTGNAPSKRPEAVSSGFMLILGYSLDMDELICSFLESNEEVFAGVAECRFWSKTMSEEKGKIIMLISPLPIRDESAFIENLIERIENHSKLNKTIPYYAEFFGFRRFSVPYETDDILSLYISDMLRHFEFNVTRKVIGSSPGISIPQVSGFESIK